MPLSYYEDCLKKAVAKGESLCFSLKDFAELHKKYRGYAVSEAEQFRKGEIISGCCDRADQY